MAEGDARSGLLSFVCSVHPCRRLPGVLAVIVALFLCGAAAAQDCPTAQSGKLGFVVERQGFKTEVFHVDGGIVRTVLRGGDTVLLETTQQGGLFQLDRLDRGRRTKYEPQSDLKKLFPLKPGRSVEARFATESDGQRGTLWVKLDVKGTDSLYIGPCKYEVLKIERSESRTSAPPAFVDTDYYSPELKLVLAKEYRGNGSGTQMVKFDRIGAEKR
jgi:hypothetical protein